MDITVEALCGKHDMYCRHAYACLLLMIQNVAHSITIRSAHKREESVVRYDVISTASPC